MSNQKIKCEICGDEVHVIQSHLNKVHHAESESPMTMMEYRNNFPNAPILSQAAIDNMHRVKKEKTDKKVHEAKIDVNKMAKKPLHELFDLGAKTEARTKKGKDILVNYIPKTDSPEMVAEVDNNYVFNIDILKTALMGIAAKIPTYLYGHAGVGKSTYWEQISARTNWPHIRLQHTINTEEAHILGQWTVKKHKDEETGQMVSETVFELGPLPLAMKNGWIYLADEYDRSYPSVLSVYQAVLEGKSLFIKEADKENRIIHPHPNFRFVATGNTNGAGDDTGLYGATVVQDAATFERFGIVQYVDYMSKRDEIEIVKNQANIVEEDAKSIVDFCHKVRAEFPAKISLTLGPRVAINIGQVGLMRGSFRKGVELCYANRLPETEKETVMQIAQRIWN